MPGGEPNLVGVFILTVPIDAAMEQTPTVVEVGLLTVPDLHGIQIELLHVGYSAVVLPVDAGGVVADLEWVDDSAADAVANLAAAFDFTVGASVARVNTTIWSGSQILDPGDSVNLEFATDGALTTASEGGTVTVMGRVIAKTSQ